MSRLLHHMRLIASLAQYGRPYQNQINQINQLLGVKRNNLSENNKNKYNTIKKGLNAIQAELKKENNRLNRMREAQRMQRKHRKATKIQAYVRGFLERRRQNRARFVPVMGPNGRISIAVRNIPTSGFRAIAAKRKVERLNRARKEAANRNAARRLQENEN